MKNLLDVYDIMITAGLNCHIVTPNQPSIILYLNIPDIYYKIQLILTSIYNLFRKWQQM